MANYNGGDNLVARYARLLIQSGKTHGEYNQKRNEIKNLLDAPVGAAIHFNLGFQQVNVEEGVNLNEVRDNIYAMIQMVPIFRQKSRGQKTQLIKHLMKCGMRRRVDLDDAAIGRRLPGGGIIERGARRAKPAETNLR